MPTLFFTPLNLIRGLKLRKHMRGSNLTILSILTILSTILSILWMYFEVGVVPKNVVVLLLSLGLGLVVAVLVIILLRQS